MAWQSIIQAQLSAPRQKLGCQVTDCSADRDTEEKLGYGSHQAARVVPIALSTTTAGSTAVVAARHGSGVVAALDGRAVSPLGDRAAVVVALDAVSLNRLVVAWGYRAVVLVPSLAGRASKAALADSAAMATLGASVVAALEGRRRKAVATLAGGGGRVDGTRDV